MLPNSSSADEKPRDAALRKTPLHRFHVENGARMVPFAGYDMPVQYPAGVLREHLRTRAAAGLFDVSHMGQIAIWSKAGAPSDAAAMLETLAPGDIAGLPVGRQRYTLLTNEDGGILDDLMVANVGDCLMLVVNAATKQADAAHLQEHLGGSCLIEPLRHRALLALQGPRAAAVLSGHDAPAAAMAFMDMREARIDGVDVMVSRSGYTGEDGFEISVPDDAAEAVARALLANDAVGLAGLGARDTLRLEAGLCLYGSDIDTETTPVEAALEWAIPKVRRTGGARAGGFPGAGRILSELAGSAARRRVGLLPEGRAPVRGGASLFAAEDAQEPCGVVTSGGFGPTAGAPVAMGYVRNDLSRNGTRLFAQVRGQRLPVSVAPLPFVPHRYKRG